MRIMTLSSMASMVLGTDSKIVCFFWRIGFAPRNALNGGCDDGTRHASLPTYTTGVRHAFRRTLEVLIRAAGQPCV